jgi:hypothetical protein
MKPGSFSFVSPSVSVAGACFERRFNLLKSDLNPFEGPCDVGEVGPAESCSAVCWTSVGVGSWYRSSLSRGASASTTNGSAAEISFDLRCSPVVLVFSASFACFAASFSSAARAFAALFSSSVIMLVA